MHAFRHDLYLVTRGEASGPVNPFFIHNNNPEKYPHYCSCRLLHYQLQTATVLIICESLGLSSFLCTFKRSGPPAISQQVKSYELYQLMRHMSVNTFL